MNDSLLPIMTAQRGGGGTDAHTNRRKRSQNKRNTKKKNRCQKLKRKVKSSHFNGKTMLLELNLAAGADCAMVGKIVSKESDSSIG